MLHLQFPTHKRSHVVHDKCIKLQYEFHHVFIYKKPLCMVTKLALSQPPISKFQTPILKPSGNALLNNAI